MSAIPRSANYVVDLVRGSNTIQEDLKKDPVATLENLARQATKTLAPPPTATDATIYHIVTITLGLVAVFSVIGAIILSLPAVGGSTPQIPDVLTALGAAAIGALAGLLAPSPGSKSG